MISAPRLLAAATVSTCLAVGALGSSSSAREPEAVDKTFSPIILTSGALLSAEPKTSFRLGGRFEEQDRRRAVKLQLRNGTEWRTVAWDTSGARGRFALPRVHQREGLRIYRWRAPATEQAHRVTSPWMRVVVETSLPTSPPDPVSSPRYGPVAATAPTSPYVTPEQYGAKGNGIADDTAELQSALRAAEGKTLWLPGGKTYKVSKTISVPSNTTVRGAGATSVMRFTWTGVNTANSGGGSNLRSHGETAHDIHLANFVLEGGGDGLPSGLKADNPQGLVPLLKLIRVDDFSVKRMELRKAEGLSVSYTGSTNGTFQRNWVHHSGRDGITGYRNQAENVTDIVVDSNLIEKVGDDAIAINGLVPGHNLSALADGSSPLPKRITISNNVIRGWTDRESLGRGIALNGVAGVVVKSNVLSHPNSTGILLTGCNSHICAGSKTDWPSTNAQLLHNTIGNATGGSRPGAIAIIKTTNSIVRGNVASASALYDFRGCSSCTIGDNVQ